MGEGFALSVSGSGYEQYDAKARGISYATQKSPTH